MPRSQCRPAAQRRKPILRPRRSAILALGIAAFGLTATRSWSQEAPAIVAREFVFEQNPVPSCHAATLAETKGGLVAAWFAGTREGADDVGIWVSRHDGSAWSKPVEVANGMQEGAARVPCWNPVLFQPPGDERLLLFYKAGPGPGRWWGMLTTSGDRGHTWSAPVRLPEGQLGPVKNKPLLLADGTLLCGSSTEHDGWRVHMESTSDWGKTWTKTEPLNDGRTFGAIQPAILRHGDAIQILCRSKQGKIVESWSRDGARTWSELAATSLPNNNSGLDAVTLRNGTSLVVYNHTTKGRTPLNVASTRDGTSWQPAAVLESEPGEYSYPAVIETSDGLAHVVYTWKRQRIRHVVLDPAKLTSP